MSMVFFLQSLFCTSAVLIILSVVVSRSSSFPSNMLLTLWLRHLDKGAAMRKHYSSRIVEVRVMYI
jgi:hypothetical protein